MSIFTDASDALLDAKDAEIADLKMQLAECFRLSGADPDGNEDWRLAPRAVEEVRRLRSERDELRRRGRRE